MLLTEAIKELLEYGRLSVDDSLAAFDESDHNTAANYLQQRHTLDCLDMPHTPPAFHPKAALWAATYLCRATQFILFRDLGEKEIKKQLPDFNGTVTPSAIYSADLTLRHLPDLARLARRISPQDILNQYFKQTAAQWPFSSVGLAIDQPLALDALLSDRSLTQAYADRIIAAKDTSRTEDARIQQVVLSQLGSHTQTFWPELKHTETSIQLHGSNTKSGA